MRYENVCDSNEYSISNRDLLSFIGEINGISLITESGFIKVILELGNSKVELISEAWSNRDRIIDHHITRLGIAGAISNSEFYG